MAVHVERHPGFTSISVGAHVILVLTYFALIKTFGPGSVVSMGVAVVILSILFLLLAPQVLAAVAAASA